MTRAVTRLAGVLVVAGALVHCHPADQPPLPPPKPTNPTALAGPPSGEILDASILVDGSTAWDAGPSASAAR